MDRSGQLAFGCAECRKAEGSEWQADRIMAFALSDRNQFKTAAAKVDNGPCRPGEGANRSIGRCACFLFAAEKAGIQTEIGHLGEKLFAVPGIASGGSGDRLHIVDPAIADQERISGKRRECFISRFVGNAARFRQVASQPCGDLLVPDRFGCPAGTLVNHKANGVRSDIDHSARRMDQAALPLGAAGLRFVHASRLGNVR